MREVDVFDVCQASPHTCFKCKSQNKDWFVDFGFELEYNAKLEEELPIYFLDGVLYLCCDCYNGMLADVERKFEHYAQFNEIKVPLHGKRIETSSERTDSETNGAEDSGSGKDEPLSTDSSTGSDGDKQEPDSESNESKQSNSLSFNNG